MLTGPNVILVLKVAVVAVTLLLLGAVWAAATGRYKLHGRLNMAFFALTLVAVLGLEVLIRFVDRRMFDFLRDGGALERLLTVHLCFSIGATIVMPLMLITGLMHKRRLHLTLAVLFGTLWIGTFITGVIFLPHTAPPISATP